MSLSETYRCARSIEAIENYARADDTLLEGVDDSAAPSDWHQDIYMSDQQFWDLVLQSRQPQWGQEFTLHQVALSEWVARVPGLYWSEGAKALRALAADAVEYKSRDWVTFKPLGKSQIVLGGIGTLKFPPDESGHLLCTLSLGHNASSGIPALISPEVVDHCHLKEGVVLTVRAKWQKMSVGWAERFPSIKGIPRGYFVLNVPQEIKVNDRDQPTQFHPCTVMEYSKGDARLFDFVYATADTRVKRYRSKIENFFSEYKNKKERYGRYLLSADIGDPLWDAEYDSPAVLRRAEAGAMAHLELLKVRVRELSFGGKDIDAIVQLMTHNYDITSLQRISDHIGIRKAQWFTGGSISDSAVQLIQKCVQMNKVEELLDAVARDRPDLILEGE